MMSQTTEQESHWEEAWKRSASSASARSGCRSRENLIKSGYRVLGYRRSSLADFEKIGGVPAKSPAEIGAQGDVVFSCVPTTEAMDEVVNGPQGLIHSARPGQIVVELGSHPVPDKQKHVAPLAAKGAAYHRRRGQRHARHGGGAQGRDLSRRRRRGRARRSSP